jgi:hypothetical protein
MLKKSISMGVFALATASFSVAANQSTFEDLQSTASAVKTHADAINAIYRTTGYDWNAEHLQAIRDETNRMGQDLNRLREHSLTPTEERAVNLATPILQAIATDASGAIRAINEQGRPVQNNGPLFNDRFHDRIVSVEANAAKAEKIFENIRNYESTRGPLESRQGDQKGLPGEPAGQPSEAGR